MLDEVSVRLDRPSIPTGSGDLMGAQSAKSKQGRTSASTMRSVVRMLGIALGSLGLFGAGWLLNGFLTNRPEKDALPPELPSALQSAESAVPVTIQPVTYREVQRTIEGVGTLNGYEEVSISSRVGGLIQRIHFEVGDRVRPGDLLMEVEPTDYRLAVDQAERALTVELAKLGLTEFPESDIDLSKLPTVALTQTRRDNAKRRADRAQELMQSHSISTEEYDNLASDYRALQAEYANQLLLARAILATVRMKQVDLDMARKKLSDTRIQVTPLTRPVPGMEQGVQYIVTERKVSEGMLVASGSEICKLVVDRTLKLTVAIPERFSPEVQLGQEVQVTTAAYPQAFQGKVTRIDPAVDTATRTFDVEIQVPNTDGQLKPGSFAKAAILARVDPKGVTVPLSALVSFAGINKIFLLEDGHAKEVQVSLGEQTSEWVEITSPEISDDSSAITSGQSLIANETPVVVRESNP